MHLRGDVKAAAVSLRRCYGDALRLLFTRHQSACNWRKERIPHSIGTIIKQLRIILNVSVYSLTNL